HLPVPHPVDELGLVVVDAPDDLARQDARLEPIGLGEADRVEDRLAGGAGLGLA
ncbi:MAG: hypothetical protein GWM91_16555, partial [Actinobacteria bacterium]|nr:hypothetical protein [Actinomycetota bacterium]NIX51916.1 hypothetical protein [Actinomycetota bacterium]